MKTQLIAIVIIALLLPIVVYSEEAATNSDTDTAITPVDTTPAKLSLFENIRLAFAGSSEKKAQILLKYAEKKQLKIEELYAQGRTKQAEQLQKKYDKYLELAEKHTKDAEEKGNDVSQLVKEAEDVHTKHLQVLQLVKAKNPDSPGLDKAIANAERNIEKQNREKNSDENEEIKPEQEENQNKEQNRKDQSNSKSKN